MSINQNDYRESFQLEMRRDKKTGDLVKSNLPIIYVVTFKGERIKYSSGYRVEPKNFDYKIDNNKLVRDKFPDELPKVKANTFNSDRIASNIINNRLNALRAATQEYFEDNRKNPSSTALVKYLNERVKGKIVKTELEVKEISFFERFDEYLLKIQVSQARINSIKVIYRALKRFELYTSIKLKQPYKLALDELTSDTLFQLDQFLKNEHLTFKKFPSIYKEVPESRTPEQRGQNTMSGIHTKFKSFILWCIRNEITTNNPYLKFEFKGETYGKVYYLTMDERNTLYKKDMSHRPSVAVQRDIFIFQCLIGCRVGDLLKMTKKNIINGAIEYIPRKTKEGNPLTVRVPLNSMALEILARYDNEGEYLLPFISSQKYNDAIKEAFTIAELKRMVTILNPTNGETEHKPLNEIASSHLARRTMVGNLYKQVKDPNLISSVSGHKEGSRAFSRYKEVDEDMKIDLMKLLE